MEPVESQKNSELSRAKEIDTGAVPLQLSNVLLGLPYKPDPTAREPSSATTRPWTYVELAAQKKLVQDINVSTTTSGKIWEFNYTWANALNMHFSGPSFRRLFGLKSFTINFQIEFRSNYQQVGQFVVFFSNLPKNLVNYHFGVETATTDPFANYQVQTQLPHTKVPMGEDLNVDVSLKWLSPHTASFGPDLYSRDGGVDPNPTVPYYDMGSLFIHVPFPMEIAAGVNPNLSVRIWSWLSDLQTGAYVPEDQWL